MPKLLKIIFWASAVANYGLYAFGDQHQNLHNLTIAGFFWLYLMLDQATERIIASRVPSKINVFLTKDEYEKMMLVHKEQTLTHPPE